MYRLTIGKGKTCLGMKGRIARGIDALRADGIPVHLDDAAEGDCLHIYAEDVDGDGALNIKHTLAHAISETVVAEYEPLLMRKVVARLRPKYLKDEKAKISEQSLEVIRSAGERAFPERDAIFERISSFLEESEHLHLDGFITFRLRSYEQELADCARQVIDDYEMERERAEFIGLLREFVAGRFSRLDVVHVLADERGLFRLVDDDGSPVESAVDDELSWGRVDEWEIDQEEALIASLVAVVPRRVVFHSLPPLAKMDMMLEIFADRIHYCNGCSLCLHRPERSTH